MSTTQPTTSDPLEEYEPKGYVRPYDDEDGRRDETDALDAAVWFTASNLGPPFDTPIDEAGEWWHDAYDCACKATEAAIVDAILAEPPEEAPSDEEVADAIGVDVRELRAFVERLEEPSVAAVLGWATCAPSAIATVEAWLDSRNGGNL